MMTLKALLQKGTEILSENEIQEAGLDAWLLLEYVTGKAEPIILPIQMRWCLKKRQKNIFT